MKNRRHNIYTLIHKALRAMMTQTLVDLGRVDDADANAVALQLRRIEDLLDACQQHLEHENRFIHAALLARSSDIRLETVADHEHHQASISRLRADLATVGTADESGLDAALIELYRNLAVFVGENLTHMQVEESVNAQLLWQHFTDDQILQIEQQIIASLTPEERNRSTLAMLANVSHSERLAMLGAMQQQIPGAAFDDMLAAVERLIAPDSWQRLLAGLGRGAAAQTLAA